MATTKKQAPGEKCKTMRMSCDLFHWELIQ